jgi:outer membrane murein-binding lipoprotein Lpp
MKKIFDRKGVLIAMSLVAAFLLTGCSGKDVPVNLDQEIQDRDERISQLEQETQQAQDELKKSQREAKDALRRASAAEANASASTTPVVPANMEGDMLPPNAKAGECFARVLIPPVYETTSERVLAKDASASIKIVPAKYEWAEERVLVKETSEKLQVVPATYKTESEKILVKAASTRMVEVPAVYETESEKVLVTPAREYWKKGRGPIEKVDGSTGEIMCLVKEDAVYKTVTRKVLKTPATTREEAIPAEYKTITRTVVDKPATTRKIEIPAEYATVKVRNLVSPPKEVRTPIEAEYRTVTKQAMVKPSYMEWRQILCETNMNQGTILDVQKALKAKSFDPGPLDGIYGGQTRSAVHAFQKANKLPTGALTYGTVKALGLSY